VSTYVWYGVVSFGLVAIPVYLVPAVSPGRMSFRTLHKKDSAPLERRMVCPEHDKTVSANHQVRGFPLDDQGYVVVTDQELERLAPEETQSIEIERFVEADEIDPIYYDRPYYLVPQEGSEKPYRLLADALADTQKVGIAKFVMRGREHLLLLCCIQEAICLVTLHFERQRVSAEGIAPEKSRVSHDDLGALIEQIDRATQEFHPGQYEARYRVSLMELVREKAKDRGTVQSPVGEEEAGAEEVDLMEMLQESLEEVKAEKSA
jgi:DNA end-binding protein Ku